MGMLLGRVSGKTRRVLTVALTLILLLSALVTPALALEHEYMPEPTGVDIDAGIEGVMPMPTLEDWIEDTFEGGLSLMSPPIAPIAQNDDFIAPAGDSLIPLSPMAAASGASYNSVDKVRQMSLNQWSFNWQQPPSWPNNYDYWSTFDPPVLNIVERVSGDFGLERFSLTLTNAIWNIPVEADYLAYLTDPENEFITDGEVTNISIVSPSTMLIDIQGNIARTEAAAFRFPLVIRTTAVGTVLLTIDGADSNITGGSYIVAYVAPSIGSGVGGFIYKSFLAPIEPVENLPDFDEYIAISDRAGLEAINNDLDGKYYLTADIDLSGEEWVPIGYNSTNSASRFTGTFDGQGYVIRNLTITEDYQYAGLFGYISGAVIKNVGLEETCIDISSSYYIGGICGYSSPFSYSSAYYSSYRTSIIKNCYNTGNISGSSQYNNVIVGGICGYSSSKSNYNPSGYSSFPASIITDCYNIGYISIFSSATAGGICGIIETDYGSGNYFYTSISNCYNTGDIFVSESATVGGICGSSEASYYSIDAVINNCFNTGDMSVSGTASIGGICGYYRHDIKNCYNTGDIIASYSGNLYHTADVGGICGDSRSTVSNCYNTGNVTASIYPRNTRVGGICGYSSTIRNCYNMGDVYLSVSSNISPYVGGICGYCSIISNCYNTGDVYLSVTSEIFSYIGGICGDIRSSISNCYNTGNISAFISILSDSSVFVFAGGISGTSYSVINNCYNLGDVSISISGSAFNTRAYAGGICGQLISSSINNCYNTGEVSAVVSASASFASAYVGGIYGDSGYTLDAPILSSVSNCYNTGYVSASALDYVFVGGISGTTGNTGSVPDSEYLIGTINNCYNTGDVSVSGSSVYAGGICGRNNGSTTNSVALNFNISVEGAELNLGRIAGISSGTLDNNHAFADMSAEGSFPEPSETYNVHDNLNGEDISAAEALTAAFWTTDTSAWTGWDTDVWQIGDGMLPILKNIGGDQGSATYIIALAVDKDDSAWIGHGKTFTLCQDGVIKYTGAGENGAVIFSGVVDGVYSLFDGDVDTGESITVNNGNEAAALDYYTVSFSLSEAGSASGSTIEAAYDGNSISSGEVVIGGKELVFIATGVGADTYTYTWGGTAAGAGASYSIPALGAPVNAVCTVTGTTQATTITYTLTISDGGIGATGAGGYAAGATVTINAGSLSGYDFNGWTSTSPDVSFADANSASTTFLMPAGDVTVTANWIHSGEGAFKPGDVSGNGSINMQDVLLIYQNFRGKVEFSEDQIAAADVNGDGIADMVDVLFVYQYFRGMITSFYQ